MPVELYVFEPRYLQLMQRCMEDSCMFGISPSIDERLGAAVRLDKVRRLPNGKYVYKWYSAFSLSNY
jgi:Lon protease-like protein